MYKLFVDVKRSTQYLMEYNKEFMFNELNDEAEFEMENGEHEETMETSP